MEGLTGGGGTGNMVIIIQSGLAHSGSSPIARQSSSLTLFNILNTCVNKLEKFDKNSGV
jgi:hypothetical protein